MVIVIAGNIIIFGKLEGFLRGKIGTRHAAHGTRWKAKGERSKVKGKRSGLAVLRIKR
jgi:hypothetical protein